MNRYKETRRRHPLAPRVARSPQGIEAERALLDAASSERAEVVMDTTDIKAADLRRRIAAELLPRGTWSSGWP